MSPPQDINQEEVVDGGRLGHGQGGFQLGARREYEIEVVRCDNDREGLGVLHVRPKMVCTKVGSVSPSKEDVDSGRGGGSIR